MKKTTLASVLLLFFLFSTKSCLASVTTRPGFPPGPLILPPLFDTDGDKVLPDVPYFLRSIFRGGAGGGVDLGWSPHQRCPRFVMEHSSFLQRGRPVVLTSTDVPKPNVLTVLNNVNISFVPAFDPLCRTSTRWTADNYDPSTGKGWINTGGSRGLRSWFNVLEYDSISSPNTYILSVCYLPSDTTQTPGEITCDYVNSFLFERTGLLRLGFQKQQFGAWAFYFEKASSDHQAKQQQIVGKEAM